MNFEFLDHHDCSDLLDRLQQRVFAVVGDFVIDAYYHLDQSRSEVSIETGLPTRAVRSVDARLGGAGNVAANLRNLGCRDVRAFGVVGDDLFGRELVRLAGLHGIDPAGLVVQTADWHTGVYTKPIGDAGELERLDIGNFNVVEQSTADTVLQRLSDQLAQIDVVVINQQLIHGVHTPSFCDGLRRLMADRPHVHWLVDSRDRPDDFGRALRKLNRREAMRALAPANGAGSDGASDGSPTPTELAQRLADRWATVVIVTAGEDGCVVCDGCTTTEIPGLHLLDVADCVGAGDAFVAGAAVGIAGGHSPAAAAYIGNLCAGISVTRPGTGLVSAADVQAAGSHPDFRYHPAVARSAANRSYLPLAGRPTIECANQPANDAAGDPTSCSEIEVVAPQTYRADRRFAAALFDFDGTISTLRQGWETVMRSFMIAQITGPAQRDLADRQRVAVAAAVERLIDQTTGVQTLQQMVLLVDVIRKWGFIDGRQIRDPLWYKERYREDLANAIAGRIAKLARGELVPADTMIKNAAVLLATLRRRGLTLYLASGTDETDVRREAAALGVVDYFNGGIRGARNEVGADPKRVVLDALWRDIGRDHGGGVPVVTFGDGPVEIRETHKRGGFGVGVAADEIRRYGLNEAKRRRLVLAGADLIVPDFSQIDQILHALRIDAP